MQETSPNDNIHPDCVTCCDKSKRIQYADEARDYMNKCIIKNVTKPQDVFNADKDVETCRKKSSDDNEELRRRAFALYKNYVESRKEGGKCPTCVYIGPGGEKVLFKGDALKNEDIYCDYDPSFNHFLSVAFMILFVMLLFTSGFIYVVANTKSLKEFFRSFILYFAIPGSIVVIGLNFSMCYFKCSRLVPCNFIYILLAVITYSILAGLLTALLETTVIFFMFAATTVVVLFWIILGFTRYNFKEWSLYLYTIFLEIAAVIALVFVFRTFTKLRYGLVQFFIALCCTMLYDVIMVMNLQMILSGRIMELDETDFAIAGILMYTSLVELFWSLIQVTGLYDKCS
ncbi:PREDICTED: uncharacterized protein LOC106103234 [Papilio polytes]|uniref:uncharacterized protein LOC106103234 n=1 Tax=Papilio polytes TaxID=76194 RepID=UPI000675C18C|nr:PREDICTED: uncharacterized protein LOC106103234 [Papilio polytes]